MVGEAMTVATVDSLACDTIDQYDDDDGDNEDDGIVDDGDDD